MLWVASFSYAMMYSWCLVLAFYPCIAVVDEGSFSLGVNVLLSAGFIAGDEVAAVAPPPPPLDVSQWRRRHLGCGLHSSPKTDQVAEKLKPGA